VERRTEEKLRAKHLWDFRPGALSSAGNFSEGTALTASDYFPPHSCVDVTMMWRD